MIVAPISGRIEEAMSDIEKAVKKGFGGIEIRYDRIRRQKLDELMENAKESGLSVVFTCMRLGENGGFEGDDNDWLGVCRRASAYEPDFMTIGRDYYERLAPQIGLQDGTERIASYHNFSLVPDNLESIYEKMWGMQPTPDVVKVAVKVRSEDEASRLLGIVESAKARGERAIAVAMGEKEYTARQRVMCLPMGAELSFFAIGEGKESARGQPTIDEAFEIAAGLNIHLEDYRR
jgi:3-dehydroquinate dehydratase type I